ncbi:hypothetical protein BDQ17DRAFT_1537806 [Cyathus striatus]|nr:hypothetical protein BDQ17DRAFT_1537806 [Cyathus striatus]
MTYAFLWALCTAFDISQALSLHLGRRWNDEPPPKDFPERHAVGRLTSMAGIIIPVMTVVALVLLLLLNCRPYARVLINSSPQVPATAPIVPANQIAQGLPPHVAPPVVSLPGNGR